MARIYSTAGNFEPPALSAVYYTPGNFNDAADYAKLAEIYTRIPRYPHYSETADRGALRNENLRPTNRTGIELAPAP